MTQHQTFMDLALEQARLSASKNEVPVGAVVVCDLEVIAQAGNRVIGPKDPCGHAEIVALRAACQHFGSERLPDCDLYVTLEPCTMCAAAISFARIRRLYFGAEDEKGGAVVNGVRFFDQPTCHHKPDVYGGFQESASQNLLREFFSNRR